MLLRRPEPLIDIVDFLAFTPASHMVDQTEPISIVFDAMPVEATRSPMTPTQFPELGLSCSVTR